VNTISSTIKNLRHFAQKHVHGTTVGDGFISLLKKLGVNDCFTRILYAQDRKAPTEGMLTAQEYFNLRQKDIEQISSLLADDLSREVYLSAIKYRQSHNPKDVPFYTKKDQYFPKDIIQLTDSEVFIDCGAFDGDTTKEFIKETNNRYKRIVCFEPVEEFYNRLKKHNTDERIIAIQAGIHKTSTTLQFNADEGKGSSLILLSEDSVSIPVRAIDDVPECRDATFIKMDIEGSELPAIIGARNTIRRNKPKLAICIYHMQRDFIEIPKFILALVPEYKLYVRHHSFSINETVLYAIPPEN